MSISRRKAREDALKILYQRDLNSELSPESALSQFETFFMKNRVTDPFTQTLVLGVSERLGELDELVGRFAENWRPERMPAVDRNILRLGAYELYHCDQIPATVTINEMVELAKVFGSERSSSFVNGILDRMAGELDRPSKVP